MDLRKHIQEHGLLGVRSTGFVTPTGISAGTQTVDVSGATNFVIGNATVVINNFSGGVDGQIIIITSVSSATSLTLKYNNSTGGDAILIDGAADRVFTGYGSVMLHHYNNMWFIVQGTAH